MKQINHPNTSGVPASVTVKDYGGQDPYATNPANGNPLIRNAQPGEPPAMLPGPPNVNNY